MSEDGGPNAILRELAGALKGMRKDDETYMPCERYILEVCYCKNGSHNAGVATWTCEGPDQEVPDVDAGGSKDNGKSCCESYRSYGKSHSGCHGVKSDDQIQTLQKGMNRLIT